MREFYRRREFLPAALALLFVIVLAVHYWSLLPVGHIKGPDEYYTLDRSHSFVIRRDYLTVYSNNKPTFKKPPFQYWMSGYLMSQGTDLEFALRFPSFLFGMLTLISAGVLAYLLYPANPWVAPAAIALMAGSLSFWRVNLSAYLDSGAMLFVTSAIIGCLLALSRPKWWYLVALAIGLAALQKAPTPLLLVGGIVVFAFASKSLHEIDFRAAFLNRHFATAAVLMVLLLSFWPVLQWIRFGSAALSEAYVEEMLNRFAVTATENMNRHSWVSNMFDGEWLLRVPGVLALLALPWFLRRMDLLALSPLWIVFAVVILFATGTTNARYALIFLPLMMAALAVGIIKFVPGRILPAIVIGVLALSQGGPIRNAAALGIPEHQKAQHVPLLRNISKMLREQETFLVCNPAPRGHRIRPAAISYYASNGKVFHTISSPSAFEKLRREGRIAPPYRGLCYADGFEQLKPLLPGHHIVETADGHIHWAVP